MASSKKSLKDEITKENSNGINTIDLLANMAYALGRIKNDLKDNNEMISNKEDVLGEIRDDLLRLVCDYKLVKK